MLGNTQLPTVVIPVTVTIPLEVNTAAAHSTRKPPFLTTAYCLTALILMAKAKRTQRKGKIRFLVFP
jgi:hypothetical protein